MYRPDLTTLVARWQDDAPVADLQEDFRYLVAVAQEHNCSQWLLDVRRRAQLNPELARWTTEVFYPEAANVLTELRVAVLCSPARLAVYAADQAQQQQLTYGLAPERAYRMQLFGDEGVAMKWLLNPERQAI